MFEPRLKLETRLKFFKFGLRESKISYNLFNGVNLSLHFKMLLSFINSGDKRQIMLLELNAYICKPRFLEHPLFHFFQATYC